MIVCNPTVCSAFSGYLVDFFHQLLYPTLSGMRKSELSHDVFRLCRIPSVVVFSFFGIDVYYSSVLEALTSDTSV